MAWSRGKPSAPLYAADGQGRLFAFNEDKGFSGPLGQTPLSPVGPMAVTLDGRLFGFCGPDLAKMFCYDPASNAVSNLGVAVSVLERRRYGYVFGDALAGRDGEIYFGRTTTSGTFGFISRRFGPPPDKERRPGKRAIDERGKRAPK